MTEEPAQTRIEKPSLLEDVLSLEKPFLVGRRERREDLESAVRIFLELLRPTDSADEVVDIIRKSTA